MRQDHIEPAALPWLLVALLSSLAACSQAGGAPSGASLAPTPADTDGTAAAPMSLSLSVDRERYQAGERILVTIDNGLAVSVYAPQRGGCSVVSLWRLDGEQWVNVDSCPTLNVYVTEIAAMSDLTRPLGPASQPPSATGPIVIGPISPSASGDDLTKLATVAPWRSGDPVRVVPEGAIAPPFSAARHDLSPGTYRIEFSYAQGSATGPVRTVHSQRFIITN